SNFDLLLCHDLPQNFFYRLAALGSHFGRSRAGTQAVQRCADQVVRIAGAQALCNHVTNAHHFENSAHWAAGDHTGTFSGWRNENGRGAMLAYNSVVQCAVLERHLDQTASCLFHCFLYSDGHFTGLAFAHADAAIAITYYGQRSKAHGATTLDHLADAVDRNHFFTQAVVVFFFGGLPALCFSHLTIPCLEFQAGFTRGVGQRFDAAMITEARTIKCNQLDTGSLCFFGDALADQAGGGNVATTDFLTGELFAHFGLERGSADEHAIAFRRNDVRVDVQIRAVDREAMNSQLADFPTGRNRTTQTGDSLVHNSSLPARLFLLGFFVDDAFIGITHTFALVR